MTTPYQQLLEADRAGTAHGNAHWSAPHAEHTNPGAMGVKDLPQQPAFALKAPAAQALAHRAGATAAQRAWASKQHAFDAFADYLDATEPAVHDPRYTHEQIREHVRAFTSTQAYRDAELQHEAVHANVHEAQQLVAAERAALTQPGDAAAESRALRYWNRTSRLLDSADPAAVINLVQETIKASDDEQLSVLVEELEPWLRAKGYEHSYLDGLFAERVPSFAAAQKRLMAAQQAQTISDADMRRLNDMIARAVPSPDGLRPQRIPAIQYDHRYDPEAAA
ncbi:hypothetical protein [Mycobacterium arosiense]|uniref:Uncharacterized protein n=1 Tax=Mycobacterium arosiense ATCC BAA-1401 = DSM 45069 TaxID=1265311 RepID=A0A1W9Z6D7_MYCAI|nr:hypothetical protein [Mycobacterium arosiense]ORA07764.1 hypothetical protein BST14_26445 [Mycobacterium arosiense ATCC BAA-1401 = DSM 45069]